MSRRHLFCTFRYQLSLYTDKKSKRPSKMIARKMKTGYRALECYNKVELALKKQANNRPSPFVVSVKTCFCYFL